MIGVYISSQPPTPFQKQRATKSKGQQRSKQYFTFVTFMIRLPKILPTIRLPLPPLSPLHPLLLPPRSKRSSLPHWDNASACCCSCCCCLCCYLLHVCDIHRITIQGVAVSPKSSLISACLPPRKPTLLVFALGGNIQSACTPSIDQQCQPILHIMCCPKRDGHKHRFNLPPLLSSGHVCRGEVRYHLRKQKDKHSKMFNGLHALFNNFSISIIRKQSSPFLFPQFQCTIIFVLL